jgi:hypothetical protein
MHAAIASIAACGDNLHAGSLRSGARLHLVSYVYEDGTREHDRERFYDSDLRELCRPLMFSDGARYCAPERSRGRSVFVDAHCRLAVGVVDEAEPPPFTTRYFSLQGEALPSRLYRTGVTVAPPSATWEQRDGTCLGPFAANGGTYFALGEELGPDRLVRVSERGGIDGTRVSIGVDSSDDGLRVPGAFYDRALDLRCSLVETRDAEAAPCVPSETLPFTDYYADARCSEPVLMLPIGEAADRAVHRSSRTACWEVREVGDELTEPTVFVAIEGTCVATSAPSGYTLFRTTPGIDVAMLPRSVVDAGGDRLAAIEIRDGAMRVSDGTLFDRVLGSDCARDPARSRAGEEVCVPRLAVGARGVFADPQCTAFMWLAFVPSGGCHPPAYFATDGFARYPVREPYVQTFYELEPGDRCGTLAAPEGFVAHRLGAPVADSDLVHARIEID